jgi:hypothetical protein
MEIIENQEKECIEILETALSELEDLPFCFQIETLLQSLENKDKEIAQLKEKLIKEQRFNPERDGPYYYYVEKGMKYPYFTQWKNSWMDNKRYEEHNCFIDSEQAIKECDLRETGMPCWR